MNGYPGAPNHFNPVGDVAPVLFIAFFCICVMTGLIVFLAQNQKAKAEIAKQEYLVALDKYRQDPSNPFNWQRALEKGRAYSILTCYGGYGGRLFEESAIQNDLQLARGAIQQTPTIPPPETASSHESVESRLRLLADLHAQALITDAEYAQRRQEILQQV